MAKGRSERSVREKKRIEKPITLIVCEGETEELYFGNIKRRFHAQGIRIVLSDEPNPEGILKCAVRTQKNLQKKGVPVDKVWLVFDAESPRDEIERKYKPIINKALKGNYLVANTSPSFEYWPLIHFAPGIQVQTPDETESALRARDRIPGYKKPKLPFEKLWDIYEKGGPSKAASGKREQYENLGENPRFARPVTYVDQLVDSLKDAYC